MYIWKMKPFNTFYKIYKVIDMINFELYESGKIIKYENSTIYCWNRWNKFR